MESNENKRSLKRGPKDDLKSIISFFVKEQLENLEMERKEEESASISRISNYSAKQLESLGVCIRKLDLVETVYSSYGKYLCQFQKRTNSDFENKISKYKFDSGDVVGLFQYGDKIHEKPLYKGIVSQFNSKKIVVAFDEEIEEETLPKNICLVQLVNQITYDRIKNGLEKLKQMEFNEKSLNLINVLFEVFEPTFNESNERKNYIKNLTFFNNELNESQKDAVRFALEVNEIGLIHGPPGTGKTTTIVEVILQLVKLGNKILVVAPSNIAVDNIGEKLIQYKSKLSGKNSNINLNFDLCRIGHPARLLPSVISNCLDTKVENSDNTQFVKKVKREMDKIKRELQKIDYREKEKKFQLKQELKDKREDIKGSYKNTVFDIYRKANIILSTCISSGENYLSMAISKENPFDYIIIDECAQGTEGLCWVPILQGKKAILAGDHLQLPPTIKSKNAEYVLSYTLFDRMISTYGDKVTRLLNTQYRMNEKIMKFSSQELYEDKLIADDTVKNHTLKDLISERYKNDKNILEEINSYDDFGIFDKPLVLLNTSGLEFFETKDPETLSSFNVGETDLCKRMVDYLKDKLKAENKDIGIITPYSAQVSNLSHKITQDEYRGLEISTVDGFQGREKEIIILSLVRSNQKNQVGFLSDKRRLNVAITRPRRMLIVIGDIDTITNGNEKENSFLKNFGEYCNENATNVNIIGTLMEYNEFEELQSMCVEEKKKEKIEENKKEEKEKNIGNKGKDKGGKKNEDNKGNHKYANRGKRKKKK
jgi:predicted DNA helicase